MSDLGDMMARAIAIEITAVVLVAVLVGGIIGFVLHWVF